MLRHTFTSVFACVGLLTVFCSPGAQSAARSLPCWRPSSFLPQRRERPWHCSSVRREQGENFSLCSSRGTLPSSPFWPTGGISRGRRTAELQGRGALRTPHARCHALQLHATRVEIVLYRFNGTVLACGLCAPYLRNCPCNSCAPRLHSPAWTSFYAAASAYRCGLCRLSCVAHIYF